MDYQRERPRLPHRGIDRSLAVEEKEMPRIMAFLEKEGFSNIVRTPEHGASDLRAVRGDELCFIEIRVRSPDAKSPDIFTIRQGKLKILGRLSLMGDTYVLLVNAQKMELVKYEEIPCHTNIKIFDVHEDELEGEEGGVITDSFSSSYPAEKRRRKAVREAISVLSSMTELTPYRVVNQTVLFALKNKEIFVQFVQYVETMKKRRPYSSQGSSKMDSSVM